MYDLFDIWLAVLLAITTAVILLMAHGNQLGESAFRRTATSGQSGISGMLPGSSQLREFMLKGMAADNLRRKLSRIPLIASFAYCLAAAVWTLLCVFASQYPPGKKLAGGIVTFSFIVLPLLAAPVFAIKSLGVCFRKALSGEN